MRHIDKPSESELSHVTCDVCGEICTDIEPYPFAPLVITIEGYYGSQYDNESIILEICSRCESRPEISWLVQLKKK